MKVILLHGDNTDKSYKRLQSFINEARKRSWEINRINKNSDLTISEYLSSKTLFQDNFLNIFDDIKNLSKKDISWIKKNKRDIDATLVLYHEGSLSKSAIKNLEIIDKAEEYKIPRSIWKFLDSFYPGNKYAAIKLLNEVKKQEPMELVFGLLCKHLQDLSIAKLDPNKIKYPSWRKAKLIKQSKKYNKDRLYQIIDTLAKADIKAKSTKAEIKDLLDFIIIEKLE